MAIGFVGGLPVEVDWVCSWSIVWVRSGCPANPLSWVGMMACGRFKVHVRAAELDRSCNAGYEAEQLIHLHASAAVTVAAWVILRRDPSSVHHCLRLGRCTSRHIDGAIFQALDETNACLAGQSDCGGRPRSGLNLAARQESQQVTSKDARLRDGISSVDSPPTCNCGRLVCARSGGDDDDLTTARGKRLG